MKDFKRAAVYHIYLRSFQDSNGDGIGDIPGVLRRLDYLAELGVEYLWITPFYQSPQRDNGYDVADYRSIDPAYGTMADFDRLVKEAGLRGIGLMLDMVFNHTSTEHEWFQKALAGDPAYKDYYIWCDPKPDGTPPTNWESKFGGPAWAYVPEHGQYYLHLFDKTQADLNWENPAVRRELRNVLRFWTAKGVKGFRFDVVNLISKPELYRDDDEGDGRRFYTDGPKIHTYLKELLGEVNAAGMVTVGEMSSTSIGHCVRYSNPQEKELSMCFSFHHLKVDYRDGQKWQPMNFDFMQLKQLLNAWQLGMQEGGGWNALFWSNHDQPRILSRFGDDKRYPVQSAKMLAAALYLMRGTPYIYQGEEIGMTNAAFADIAEYRDVESLRIFDILSAKGVPQHEILAILRQRSRDNARTPMQWSGEKNAGFTDGIPWLGVNANHTRVNAEAAKQGEHSILSWYQTLIRMRKELDVVALGTYKPLLTEHSRVLAYQREHEGGELLVLANFYGEPTEVAHGLPEGDFRCLLSNYETRALREHMELRPYETLVYYKSPREHGGK